MPQFNLTPHWITFVYTVMNETHVQKFSVNSLATVPNPDPTAVELIDKSGNPVTLQAFATQWTDILGGYFDGTQSTFDSLTLWYQADGALEPTFISAAVTTNPLTWNQPDGTGGAKLGAQETQTYRAEDGRILKIVLMETVSQPHYRVALSSVTAPHLTPLISYMISAQCVIQSRSDAYPMAPMNRTGVFNDRMVRERYNVD